MARTKKLTITETDRLASQIINVALARSETYLEECEEQRRARDTAASAEFERLALAWEAGEAERKRLWGNKYPRVLGQVPPGHAKPTTPPTLPGDVLDHKKAVLTKECARCHTEFKPYSRRQIYCDARCRQDAINEKNRAILASRP